MILSKNVNKKIKKKIKKVVDMIKEVWYTLVSSKDNRKKFLELNYLKVRFLLCGTFTISVIVGFVVMSLRMRKLQLQDVRKMRTSHTATMMRSHAVVAIMNNTI